MLPRKVESCWTMPRLIAQRTSSQPPVWAAASPTAASRSMATRSRLPSRYRVRRVRPVRCLCCNELVSEEGCERAAGAYELGGRAGLGHAPVDEHNRAVGDLYRREPLGCDQHGAAVERGPEPVDEQALGLGVDGGHRIVEHDNAGTGQQGS